MRDVICSDAKRNTHCLSTAVFWSVKLVNSMQMLILSASPGEGIHFLLGSSDIFKGTVTFIHMLHGISSWDRPQTAVSEAGDQAQDLCLFQNKLN